MLLELDDAYKASIMLPGTKQALNGCCYHHLPTRLWNEAPGLSNIYKFYAEC